MGGSNRQVHVITTTYRPVPLEHHLFAGGELHAVRTIEKREKRRGGEGGRGGPQRLSQEFSPPTLLLSCILRTPLSASSVVEV